MLIHASKFIPLLLLLLLVILSILSQIDAKTKLSKLKNLEEKYNLTSSKYGRDGIDSALNILLNQEEQAMRIRPIVYPNKLIASLLSSSSSSISTSDSSITQALLPLCEVSYSQIMRNGLFIYLGHNDNNTKLRYNNDCFARRIRYHTSPICEKIEREEHGIIPITSWKWTLRTAIEQKCRMPDVSNIIQAAKSYLNNQMTAKSGLRPYHNASLYKDEPGRAVNIVMLGLSFMGQPFQSLICLNQEHLNHIQSYGKTMNYKNNIYVREIIRNNGSCTGFTPSQVKDFYPPELHPNNYPIPIQNGEGCNLEHSLMVFNEKPPAVTQKFASSIDQPITVRVCYRYTFNMQKNVNKMQGLPCNMTWHDIDIILTFDDQENFEKYYFPRLGANIEELEHLSVIYIGNIYQGLLFSQLKASYMANNFQALSLEHFQAKPKSCSKPDVHYRLPGVTDHAADVWLSLIATGLKEKENKKECQSSSESNTCATSYSGKIKFYHVNVAEKISTTQSSVHNNDIDGKVNIYDRNDNNNNNIKNHGGSGGRSSSKRKNKPKNMVDN